MSIDLDAVEQTLVAARGSLLAARSDAGHWVGELSSSALSTATAVYALVLLDRALGSEQPAGLVRRGFTWLAEHQNSDGGWGDTVDSPSNISTTTLCWALLGVDERAPKGCESVTRRAEAWLKRRVGELTPENLARAIGAAYGDDRTFSTPILTMCALAGRFGTGRQAWRSIPALPFELAACPHSWFRRLGLPVVSYALPALIAIGQVRYHHRPTRNPLARCLRFLTRGRTLRVLQSIQPESGGFLEAIPLTSFVVMSLVSAGQRDHPVVKRGQAFLTASVRADGSWPIDTNLATWVTTLSIDALAAGDLATHLSAEERANLRTWLLAQQYREEHPYTHAAPGGWAWTDLSGGVPDADDTSGALLALWHLVAAPRSAGTARHSSDNPQISDNRWALPTLQTEVHDAVIAGVRWLLNLQNSDGGIPTFCRGWGKLPFDRSSPDLTAHALRAWHAWRETVPDDLRQRLQRATRKALWYLVGAQCEDGSWTPLWFGNQVSPNEENPLYGTTRVLRGGEIVSVDGRLGDAWSRARRWGVRWVLSAQNRDGGWGGAASVPSSVEETALAVEALAGVGEYDAAALTDSIGRGCAWLSECTDCGRHFDPAPIGLYFARLWYHERLYPLVFTTAVLERVTRMQTTA